MTESAAQPASVQREQVLARQLSAGQQAMMALGGSIGTGLFLASGLAVNVAGPAIILSYLISAAIALLLTAALTEMAVTHPTAGSFGVYAGMYVSPFAGYAVRVSYWLMEIIATGGHLVAISIYMSYWLPAVPGYLWVLAFGALIVYLNARAVGTFGEVEYWFVMIKVVAIALFIVIGFALMFGATGEPAIGLRNYTADGGFIPLGWAGVWLGSCFTLYSFIGVEIVAVTSGEATDPRRTIPRAMLRMILGLAAIYILMIVLLVGITPWRESANITESPFVGVLTRIGIPGAASVMNFVVLSAALSAANANLYLITRSMFSLARGGFVPASLGAVNARGTPVNALLLSSAGLGLAVVIRALWPDTAYQWFFGVALFGGLFVYLMIFVTHLSFRRRLDRSASPPVVRLPLSRLASLAGAVLILATLVTTYWAPGLDWTLRAAGPWLLVLAIGYRAARRRPPVADPPFEPVAP
jgi:L-asparagine transporter-like permease